MIIETRCDPRAVYDKARDEFNYEFDTPITLNVERIALAKPAFYRGIERAGVGSIISVGGTEFGVEIEYEELTKAMKNVANARSS